MHNNTPMHYPFIWFEAGSWWFKAFGECFGPYPDAVEARYHLMVMQGLSQRLREAVAQ